MASRILTRCAILAGSVTAAFVTPAAAQIANPTAVLDSLDFGAITNRLVFTPSVDIAYDTNVARASPAVAKARGLIEDDEIYSPSLLADILQPLGRNSVFLAGTAGYNFYGHNSILNREQLSLNGGANVQLAQCRGTLSGGYARHQNNLEDVTRGQVQDTFDSTTVSGNASCGGNHGFSPVLSVSETWSDNSSPLLQTSNLQTFSVSGGLAYHSPTLGVASLFGQYSSTYFPNRVFQVPTIHDGVLELTTIHDSYEVEGAGMRYERMLGARIQGTVAISYTHISTSLSNGSSFSGLTYETDLSYRASSRLGFHGSFNRQILPTNLLDAAYRVQSIEEIDGTYSVGARLQFNLGGSLRQSQLKGPALMTGLDVTRDDDRSIFGSATYTVRKVSFTISLRNDRRTANVVGLNYWDTRADASVSATF